MREYRFVFVSWFAVACLLNIAGFVSCASATIMVKPQLLPDNTVDVSAFRSLQEANNAKVATGRILTVTAAVTVSTDTVIDKTLRFSGARITVAPEVKLTIYKPIEAGEYQLFDFDTTKPVPVIRLSGNGEWRTSWFLGASGFDSDKGRNSRTLQMMFDSIGNGTILFDGGYTIDTPVTLRTLVSIRGNGKNGKAGLSLAKGANCALFTTKSGTIVGRITISDMYFCGSRPTNLTGGCAFDLRGYLTLCEIRNCWFFEFRDTAVKLASAGSLSLNNVDAHFNDCGVSIESGAGISITGCNIENNYRVGLKMTAVNGFSVSGSYFEGNPGITPPTTTCEAQILLSNCSCGVIQGSYFVNFGATGVKLINRSNTIRVEQCWFQWANGVAVQQDKTCYQITAANNRDIGKDGKPTGS